jgi:hypothetical protein
MVHLFKDRAMERINYIWKNQVVHQNGVGSKVLEFCGRLKSWEILHEG